MGAANNINYAWELIKIFFYLGVVVVLIYLLNHFLRNSRQYFGRHTSMIRVIDRGALNQHSQVCIVQVGEKYYLLGITQEKVTLLDTFDDLGFVPEETFQPQTAINFQEVFKRTFGKKDGGNE